MKKYALPIFSIVVIFIVILVFLHSEKLPTFVLESSLVKARVTAANNGDKDAMWDLYFHFEESGKKDRALYWLRKGASSGDPRALYRIYSLLKDSPKQTDRKEAIEALKLAANGGDSFSALQLGKQYIAGGLVDRDVESGKKWLKFAALDGSVEGMLVLGNNMALNCSELDKAYGLALLANDLSGKSKTYQIEAHKLMDNVRDCARKNRNDVSDIEQRGFVEFHKLKKMLDSKQGGARKTSPEMAH